MKWFKRTLFTVDRKETPEKYLQRQALTLGITHPVEYVFNSSIESVSICWKTDDTIKWVVESYIHTVSTVEDEMILSHELCRAKFGEMNDLCFAVIRPCDIATSMVWRLFDVDKYMKCVIDVAIEDFATKTWDWYGDAFRKVVENILSVLEDVVRKGIKYNVQCKLTALLACGLSLRYNYFTDEIHMITSYFNIEESVMEIAEMPRIKLGDNASWQIIRDYTNRLLLMSRIPVEVEGISREVVTRLETIPYHEWRAEIA